MMMMNIDVWLMFYNHACVEVVAYLDWLNPHRILKIKFQYKDLLFIAFQQ
jgi:hypothetical protein